MIDHSSLRDEAFGYFNSRATNLMFVLTEDGRIIEANVYAGTLLPQSFYFTFKPVADRILAFGRLDAEELESVRKEVLAVNQDLNNLTRELHKKNVQLVQKEKALTQSISDLKLAQTKLVESEKMQQFGEPKNAVKSAFHASNIFFTS